MINKERKEYALVSHNSVKPRIMKIFQIGLTSIIIMCTLALISIKASFTVTAFTITIFAVGAIIKVYIIISSGKKDITQLAYYLGRGEGYIANGK